MGKTKRQDGKAPFKVDPTVIRANVERTASLRIRVTEEEAGTLPPGERDSYGERARRWAESKGDSDKDAGRYDPSKPMWAGDNRRVLIRFLRRAEPELARKIGLCEKWADWPYYVSYYERPGLRKTVYAGKDMSAAETLSRKLETDALLRGKGIVDERAEAWAGADARPITEHVEDFIAALRAAGRSEIHVTHVKTHVDRIVGAVGATRLSHLTPSAVQRAIGDLVKRDKLSLRTGNAHLTSLKAFSRWAWQDGRARDYTLGPLRSYNAETDRKRVRRVLSDPEIGRLIRTAYEGPTVQDMNGPDRAILYLTALGSGLRRRELAALRPEDFDLGATPPAILLPAKHAKNRRETRQIIPVGLADALRDWLTQKPRGKSVFGPLSRAAEMLKVDLDAAEIKDTPEGVVDFHALRHSYITRLALSRAPVKLIQTLARHSTPVLTLSRYAHAGDEDKAAALAMLPALEAPLLRSGTESPSAGTARGTAHALHLALQRGNTGQQRPDDARDGELDNDAVEVVSSQALGEARPDLAPVGTSKFASAAGVAEWQTRGIQNPVGATP